jgi:hypothetical protein
MRMMEWMIRRGWVVVVAVLGLTALAVLGARKVQSDNSLELWFDRDDPQLVAYQGFLDRFQGDQFAVIGVFADDVFAPAVLEKIDRLTQAFEELETVHRVRSLSKARIFRADGDFIEVGPLVPELPKTEAESQAIRKQALDSPLLKGLLVARDGRATVIVAEVTAGLTSTEAKIAFTREVEAILEREKAPGIQYYLTGTPPTNAAFTLYSRRDLRTIIPLMALLVVAVCLAVFRRISAAFIPLVVVALSAVWTQGVMGALGFRSTVVTTVVPVLILAVGVLGSIHILDGYFGNLRKGLDKAAAVMATVRHLFVPMFFTFLTTTAGLLSLVASPLKPIREFGILAATGVGFSYLLSFSLVPILLKFTRQPPVAFLERQSRGPLARLLTFFSRQSPAVSRAVLAGAAVLFLGSMLSLNRMVVGSNPLEYFKKDAPVRVSTMEIDRALGGTTSLELVVDAGPEGFKDPVKLQKLAAFEEWIEQQPAVNRAASIIDNLKEANRVLHGGDSAKYALPDSRELASQYYFLMEGEEDFKYAMTGGYSVGRISVRAERSKSYELPRLTAAVEAKAAELEAAGIKVTTTGWVKMVSQIEDYLVQSQIQSFTFAFPIITVLMALLLRSLRLGLVAMVPNVTPIAFGLGFMALVGINLDPGTVMIASIGLGLVVDDTVHFMVNIAREMKSGRELKEAVAETIQEVGRPCTVSALVLAASFSIMMLGSFGPNVNFGLVASFVIACAWLVELVVTPSVLMVLRPRLSSLADREPGAAAAGGAH